MRVTGAATIAAAVVGEEGFDIAPVVGERANSWVRQGIRTPHRRRRRARAARHGTNARYRGVRSSESGISGSVGAAGGKPPAATRAALPLCVIIAAAARRRRRQRFAANSRSECQTYRLPPVALCQGRHQYGWAQIHATICPLLVLPVLLIVAFPSVPESTSCKTTTQESDSVGSALPPLGVVLKLSISPESVLAVKLAVKRTSAVNSPCLAVVAS